MKGTPPNQSENKYVWCAREDDFRTPLGDFVAVLPQIEFHAGLST